MHIVQLSLETTSYDRQIIGKRFHAISHIHNVLVKHAKKCLIQLRHDKVYKETLSEYSILKRKDKLSKEEKSHKKDKLSKTEKSRIKELSKILTERVRNYSLSEYDFQSYIKLSAKQFRKCLSSQQVQKEATRVWKGVEKVLYGNGKDIHFKRFRTFSTICGKTNTNGIKFDKASLSIEWLGLDIQCKFPKDNSYMVKALNADISYCEIKRSCFPNGWHYYLIVYLKGDAPHKLRGTGTIDNISGVDIGTSTVAVVSDDKVTLEELAPKCSAYNKKIIKLSQRIDNSKKTSNPLKYRSDGTINSSNHDKWVFSKTYFKLRDKLASIYRKKSAYIKQSHEELINSLLKDSVNFITEDMSFSGLQRRAKKTERQDKISEVKQKDGSTKKVRKYKRKKRFGRSLNNRAPASFIAILERKAKLYGGLLCKVNTKKFRASQYDHVTDEYKKCELDERDKLIGGHKVQRDLYSGFLLKNSNLKLDAPDRDKCIYGFEKFLELQDELINKMITDNISMKQCFGF